MVRHPRDAPTWTFVPQTTPANTDFSAPGTPGAIYSPPQLDDIGFEAGGEGEGGEGGEEGEGGAGGGQGGGESSQNRP
jgi:hypothetical protein